MNTNTNTNTNTNKGHELNLYNKHGFFAKAASWTEAVAVLALSKRQGMGGALKIDDHNHWYTGEMSDKGAARWVERIRAAVWEGASEPVAERYASDCRLNLYRVTRVDGSEYYRSGTHECEILREHERSSRVEEVLSDRF